MEEQTRRRRRNRRKPKRNPWLPILGVGLAALVGAGLIFSRCSADPEETQETQETVQTQPQDPAAKGETVINICVAGDLNVTDYLLEQAAQSGFYDFTQTFLDVGPVLSSADLTLLNFEGNLSGGSFGAETGAAPLELPKALTALGVDAVQTANSAAIRQGVSGLVTTLDAFENLGLMTLGTFADSADFRKTGGYEVVEVEGIRIALVAFTKGMDNLGLPAGSEDCVNLLYEDYSSDYKKVATDRIAKVLRNVREEQPDLTIAMVHWGSEYNTEVSDTQKKIRKQLLEGGVDIIVGSHPHVLQDIEYDPIEQTLVAWSLGDFVGDAQMAGSNYSLLLDLEITRIQSTGETYLSGFDYTPIYTLRHEDSIPGGHRVVRIREAMARYEANYVGSVTDGTYKSMTKAMEKIEERVNPKKDK